MNLPENKVLDDLLAETMEAFRWHEKEKLIVVKRREEVTELCWDHLVESHGKNVLMHQWRLLGRQDVEDYVRDILGWEFVSIALR